MSTENTLFILPSLNKSNLKILNVSFASSNIYFTLTNIRNA